MERHHADEFVKKAERQGLARKLNALLHGQAMRGSGTSPVGVVEFTIAAA